MAVRRTPVMYVFAIFLVMAFAAAAQATVRKTAFTATVSPNDTAMLSVKVSPRARCTIEVVYDTVISHAKGLGAKSGTRITWRWKVGSATHAGRWPVKVGCGHSGKLTVRLRVRS